MAKHRIVLIEDSDADVWLLRECLEAVAIDHELIILQDGAAALAFIEAEREGAEPRPCIIVLDLHLPKHDGLELLTAIRRAPALEHIAALVISSAAPPATVRQIEEYGGEYAEKPNSLAGYEALARKVWEICESKFRVAV